MRTYILSAEILTKERAKSDYLVPRATPGVGDVLRVPPGERRERVLIRGMTGTADDPVRIVPHILGWIDGRRVPDPRAGHRDDYLLQLVSCEHVVIDGLMIANAWPTAIALEGCRDVTVRNCRFRGGRNAVYARYSEGINVTGCDWTQDTSPDHDLWHRIDWVEAHGDEGGNNSYAYFNGALLQGKHVNRVTVTDNTIRDAYNGIRLKTDDERDEPDGPITSRAVDHNRDIVIARNTFERIRDNPVEPERHARNMVIAHNVIVDAHGWFSLDGVAGSRWYIYGNCGGFRTRQGARSSMHHTMGRVLKLSFEVANSVHAAGSVRPDGPWTFAHNSFLLRCPLIGGAAPSVAEADLFGIGPDFTRHLTFANNAFEWCDPTRYDEYVSEHIALLRHFVVRPEDDVTFDGSLTNRADYVSSARALGLSEASARTVDGPVFRDAPAGDFTVLDGSPGRDACAPLEMLGPDGGTLRFRPNANGRLHTGAVQDDGLATIERVEIG